MGLGEVRCVLHELIMGNAGEGVGELDVRRGVVDVLDIAGVLFGDGLLLLDGGLLVLLGHDGRS